MDQSGVVTVNLNDSCEVVLTAHGVDVMRKYYDDLKMRHILKRQYPLLVPGMVLKTQLWDLFQMFGASISLGSETPFSTEIKVVQR